MKLAVYDKQNKSRLLGHLEVRHELRGPSYTVAVMDSMDYREMYLCATAAPGMMKDAKVPFDIDIRQEHNARQIDWATREVTTYERKNLITDAPLETLMKLDRFYLPGESVREQKQRLHYAGQ